MLKGRAWVLLWLVFLGVCGAIAARAHFTTDLSAFLPRAPTPEQQLLVDQLREGVVSQLILIGLEGAPAEQLARVSDALTDRLAQAPEFAYVNNGAQERIEADGRFLMRHRYLLSPGVTPERFTVAGLQAALQEDLELLASPVGSLAGSLLPADPTGEFLRLLDLLQAEGSGPQKRDGVWFSADGKRALLIAQTRAPGFDIDAQERALAQLRSLFRQVSSELHAEGVHMIALSPGVFAVDVRAAIKHDVARISLFALVLVSFLLLVVFRSPRVLILTLLPVVTGATAGIAAVSLAFGSVHGITLGFGVTLLGEGVDYAIYLFTNSTSGRGRDAATGQMWRTLRLGVLTSVCGFGVMLLSDFSGLAQLGLFSIAGLVVAFAVTRFVLPQLLPEGYRAQPLSALGPLLQRLVQAAPILRYPLVILVAACVVSLALRGHSVWDDRIESLSPVPEADKQAYERLQSDLGAPEAGYLLVVSQSTQQAALEDAERVAVVLDRLQQGGTIGGFQSPAQLLPSDRVQRLRQQALPDILILQSNLVQAARGSSFRPELFQPFLQDAARVKGEPLLTVEAFASTGLKVRLDSLLAQRHDGWVAILSLREVRDVRVLAAALDDLHLPTLHLLDLKQATNELYRGYRHQALQFALIGVAAIVLLLLIALRSARRTFDVLVPLAAALVVTSAAFSFHGRELSIFHLIGMLLVVGVGSNYTLFFERHNLLAGDRQRIVTSLVLCNASTAIGFGLLALARAPVLNAIGATVALGAFLSLVFAAVLARRGDSTSGWR